MEPEFKAKNPTPAPGYPKMLIESLRTARQEHPVADAAAGMIPGVGVGQAAMDATDPDASDFQRMLAVGSILPGMRLMRALAGRLRGVKAVKKVAEDIPFSPEEIFQKPSLGVATKPETVEAANKAYAEQLLREEAEYQKTTASKLREPTEAELEDVDVPLPDDVIEPIPEMSEFERRRIRQILDKKNAELDKEQEAILREPDDPDIVDRSVYKGFHKFKLGDEVEIFMPTHSRRGLVGKVISPENDYRRVFVQPPDGSRPISVFVDDLRRTKKPK